MFFNLAEAGLEVFDDRVGGGLFSVDPVKRAHIENQAKARGEEK